MSRDNGQAVTALDKPRPAQVQRTGLTEQEVQQVVELSTAATSAQARMEVEARIAAARRWPRNLDQTRVNLLSACRRTRFAEVARYAKPVGKKKNEQTGEWEQGFAEGFSIRFAEEANRQMGNLASGSMILFEDDTKRGMRVFVGDLETNTYRDTIITVSKTVERRSLKKGQAAIRSRLNSYGELVHVVEATDDEVLVKQRALEQKAWRNLVLGMVPADILEEALDAVQETLAREDQQDPAAARKRLVDAFAAIGVMPNQLQAYLGHEVASCSPAELERLRKLYASVKTGESSWADIVRNAEESDEAKAAEQPAAASTVAAPPKNLADLTKAKKAKTAAPTPAPRGDYVDVDALDEQPPPPPEDA